VKKRKVMLGKIKHGHHEPGGSGKHQYSSSVSRVNKNFVPPSLSSHHRIYQSNMASSGLSSTFNPSLLRKFNYCLLFILIFILASVTLVVFQAHIPSMDEIDAAKMKESFSLFLHRGNNTQYDIVEKNSLIPSVPSNRQMEIEMKSTDISSTVVPTLVSLSPVLMTESVPVAPPSYDKSFFKQIHFVHIPKCGGTTMTAVLRQVQCELNPVTNADCCKNPGFCDYHAFRRCESIKGCINHFPNRKFIVKKTMPSFVVFREPTAR
jgi:hypothetical protein